MKASRVKLTLLVTLAFAFLTDGLVGETQATIYVESFDGDLNNWTPGPSHLDAYYIDGEQLYIDGYGHLKGTGGWGVLQFNQTLGSNFSIGWDAKITEYDYANFVLFADTPWDFDTTLGYANNGYITWLDIDDPYYPMIDMMKRVNGASYDLVPETRNISLAADIANGQWFHWDLRKIGNSIQVYIDNQLVIDSVDASFTDADFKFGLSFGEDSRGYFDNLVIDTAPVPEPTTILLLGTGLIGLIGARRKIKK